MSKLLKSKILVIVKIYGGLGNQMFQYAFGRTISLKYNTQLYLDLSWFNELSESTPRKFQLDLFNTEYRIADKKILQQYKPLTFKVINTALIRLNIGKLQLSKYFVENNLAFNSSIDRIKDNCYINGYWQSEKYFINIKEIIKKEFKLKECYHSHIDSSLLNSIKSSNSISVHIRRSDYTLKNNIDIHGTLPISYYEKSMEIISKNTKNPTYFIFSDDIDWVKKSIKNNNSNINYITNNSNYVDFFLKSQCKHNIIANSTFSWWSAWLNNNENKLVIAPKNWYINQKFNKQTKDLIPESWIRI